MSEPAKVHLKKMKESESDLHLKLTSMLLQFSLFCFFTKMEKQKICSVTQADAVLNS